MRFLESNNVCVLNKQMRDLPHTSFIFFYQTHGGILHGFQLTATLV